MKEKKFCKSKKGTGLREQVISPSTGEMKEFHRTMAKGDYQMTTYTRIYKAGRQDSSRKVFKKRILLDSNNMFIGEENREIKQI